MQRLAGIGHARDGAHAAPHRLNIRSARSSLGATELLDHRGMLVLGLGDVARIEIARRILREGGRHRDRGSRKQQGAFTHRIHISRCGQSN